MGLQALLAGLGQDQGAGVPYEQGYGPSDAGQAPLAADPGQEAAQRRIKLITDAFKLLSQPSRQPARKKAIGKKDLLPLILAGVGAGFATKSPGAVGKGLLAFAGAREAGVQQDYQDQTAKIAEENRVRGVGAEQNMALAGIAGDQEKEFKQKLLQEMMHRHRLSEIGAQNQGKATVAGHKAMLTFLKDNPEGRAAYLQSNGGDPGLVEAIGKLTPKEQLEIAQGNRANAQTGEIQTMLPIKASYMGAGTNELNASAANKTFQTNRGQALLPGEVQGQAIKNEGGIQTNRKLKNLADLSDITLKYGDRVEAAKLAKIEGETKDSATRANAAIIKANQTVNDPAKGRVFAESVNKAEAAVAESEGAIAYLDSMAPVWQARLKRAQDNSDKSGVEAANQWLESAGAKAELLRSKAKAQRAALDRLRQLVTDRAISGSGGVGSFIDSAFKGSLKGPTGKKPPPNVQRTSSGATVRIGG